MEQKRFECFHQASGLAKEEESQINMLIYPMGDQADDILNSFKLSTKQLKQYHTMQAKFNQCHQEEDETIETFITALHALATHCNFGSLKDEMI